VAAVLAAAYLAADPHTADHAAQLYRSELFEREGFALWDNGWYSGHHLPAYSLLFPPLGALLGAQVAGALAAVAAAAIFERLSENRVAALWFAAATATLTLTGRLTFALGLAIGLGCVLAMSRGKPAAAIVLAALTSLASPVAGAFLALAAVAVAVADRRAQALGVAAAALAPALSLNVAFPEGGDFPFELDAFLPPLAATVLLWAVMPRQHRTLRTGIALYGLAILASAALPTAMGGNVTRLGALLAGPLLAMALLPGRVRLVLLLAPVFVYWQWSSAVDDVSRAASDESTRAGYYDGVLRFLTAHGGEPFRVEVPFTDNHWESYYLARRLPLARGWERQLDRKVNALFYEDRLPAGRYLRWLHDNAVRFVALADAPLDYSAAREADVARRMRVVWRDEHWRVLEVPGPRPLADGARTTRLGTDFVELAASETTVRLRVRWSPYWAADRGCVEKAGDWMRLRLPRPGPVRLRMAFSAGRIGRASPRGDC
jgi:hypothetical protein